MTATEMLTIAALAASLVVSGVAIYAFLEISKTMKAARGYMHDTSARLGPLLDKADVTIDAVNAELLRVDGIVTTFEEVSDRVGDTTRTVQAVANAPREVANAMGPRLRSAWREARRARKAR